MIGGGPLALAPEVEAFRQQFELLSTAADALVAPLTDLEFHHHPAADAWSVGDCIEHLNATARLYLPTLDRGIADAIRRGLYGAGPFRYGYLGRLLLWGEEPPVRWRRRTAAALMPAHQRPRHEVMAAFRAYQVQYVDRLRQANGLDLAHARVSAPQGRWLRISLGSAFALIAAHERRHIQQAATVIGGASNVRDPEP